MDQQSQQSKILNTSSTLSIYSKFLNIHSAHFLAITNEYSSTVLVFIAPTNPVIYGLAMKVSYKLNPTPIQRSSTVPLSYGSVEDVKLHSGPWQKSQLRNTGGFRKTRRFYKGLLVQRTVERNEPEKERSQSFSCSLRLQHSI